MTIYTQNEKYISAKTIKHTVWKEKYSISWHRLACTDTLTLTQKVLGALIADTIAPGSPNQIGSLAGYIIHYHKSDAPTQTGAA